MLKVMKETPKWMLLILGGGSISLHKTYFYRF